MNHFPAFVLCIFLTNRGGGFGDEEENILTIGRESGDGRRVATQRGLVSCFDRPLKMKHLMYEHAANPLLLAGAGGFLPATGTRKSVCRDHRRKGKPFPNIISHSVSRRTNLRKDGKPRGQML